MHAGRFLFFSHTLGFKGVGMAYRHTIIKTGLLVLLLNISACEPHSYKPSTRLKTILSARSQVARKIHRVTPKMLHTIAYLESSNGTNTKSRFEPHILPLTRRFTKNKAYQRMLASSHGEYQILGLTALSLKLNPWRLKERIYNKFAAIKVLEHNFKLCKGDFKCAVKRYNGSGKKADAYLKRYLKVSR